MIYQNSDSSDHWTITHNLHTLTPHVDCRVDIGGTKTKIVPIEVVSLDEETVKIIFSKPYCGEAEIIQQKRWSDLQ